MRRLLAACALALPFLATSTGHLSATSTPYKGRIVRACTTGAVRCDAERVIPPHTLAPAAAVTGLSPQDFHAAYHLPTTPAVGIPDPTIAIVDAFNDPTVEQDLSAYDRRFNLPDCTEADGCLQVLNERGQSSPLPVNDSGWSEEIALDVETAHGICQTCRIMLVEADAPSLNDLGTAVQTAARLGAAVISNSYGGQEDSSETSADKLYHHPGVAVVASSGDSGYGSSYPAAYANVVSVGGTSLTLMGGQYAGESVWDGAGSGCSKIEPAASWQQSVSNWRSTGCGMGRAIADVSADADPYTGAAVYVAGTWMQVGGTSLAAPLIASTFALAGGVPAGVEAPSVLYAHASALHDITSGSNGLCGNIMCAAAPGYDGPSGLGSPNGLGAFQSRQQPTPTPTATATAIPTVPAPVPTDTPVMPTATSTPPPPPASPTPTATKRPGRCRQWSQWFDEKRVVDGKNRHAQWRYCRWYVSG